ncbi:putative LRR containing protein, partial [Trachipleistophora hominis]
MTLEDVTLSNGCIMLLHKHITKVELERFTGLIRISNIVRNESCVSYLDSGTCQLQRTDEGSVQELTLFNANLISTTTTTEHQIDLNDGLNLELSNSIKKICLKNCCGVLLFEDWPIFRKIVFEQDNRCPISGQMFQFVRSE